MFGVGRDLCGSSTPTPLPKQGHLQQAAQDLVQAGLVNAKVQKQINRVISHVEKFLSEEE